PTCTSFSYRNAVSSVRYPISRADSAAVRYTSGSPLPACTRVPNPMRSERIGPVETYESPLSMDTIVKDYKYNPRANRLCSMMRAKDDLPQDVSESVETLDQALQDANYITARKLTTELTTSSELDTVLELLARYAKSQPQATELLVEVLDATGTVRRFAAGALLDQTAVDDVSQDALISIADSVDSYDGRSKVTTWVHTIVRRR